MTRADLRIAAPALAVGIVIGVLLVVIGGNIRGTRQSVPAPAPNQEAIEKGELERRQEAARQEEAGRQDLERQRQREAELQRERERYQEQVRKAQEQARANFRNAVKACVSTVRERSGYSRFDAYITGDSVRYVGSVEERFQFDKCMADRGIELDKGPKP
jgi:hypothetical protein